MQEIFNELIRFEEAIKKYKRIASNKLKKDELNELNEFISKIPVSSFEEFKNDIIKQKNRIESIINNTTPQHSRSLRLRLDKLESIDLESSYLSFIEERNRLLQSGRLLEPWIKEYDNIKKKFCEQLIIKKNQERFVKDNLLKVIEIVSFKIRDTKYMAKIVEILPKPTDDEYCKTYVNIAKLSETYVNTAKLQNKWTENDKDDWNPYELCEFYENKFMNKYKNYYKNFVNNFMEIKHFYQIEEFRKKQKEREYRHINWVKRVLYNCNNDSLNNVLSEEELENKVKSYFEDKHRKELITYIVKNKMNEFYDSFKFEFDLESLSKEDESYLDSLSEDNRAYDNDNMFDERFSQDRFGNIYDSDLHDRERFIEDNCF